MSADTYEVIVATFPDEESADSTMKTLEEMAKSGSIEIVDAGVLVRSQDGSTSVRQHSLPTVGGGAKVGAIIGAVIGAIFPPAIIGSALVGAGIGAGTAAIAKQVLKSDDLEEAAKDLEPGTSAIIAVVQDKWVDQLQTAMQGYSKLAEHALDADSAARLMMSADEETGEAAASFGGFATDEDGTVVAATMDAVTDGAGTVAVTGTAAAISDEGVAVRHVEAAGTGLDTDATDSGDDASEDPQGS